MLVTRPATASRCPKVPAQMLFPFFWNLPCLSPPLSVTLLPPCMSDIGARSSPIPGKKLWRGKSLRASCARGPAHPNVRPPLGAQRPGREPVRGPSSYAVGRASSYAVCGASSNVVSGASSYALSSHAHRCIKAPKIGTSDGKMHFSFS